MTRRFLPRVVLLLALASACPVGGCGPAAPEPAASGAPLPNPTRRLMGNDPNSELYKKMVGKDGKLLWKPGMPKKAPAETKK